MVAAAERVLCCPAGPPAGAAAAVLSVRAVPKRPMRRFLAFLPAARSALHSADLRRHQHLLHRMSPYSLRQAGVRCVRQSVHDCAAITPNDLSMPDKSFGQGQHGNRFHALQ